MSSKSDMTQTVCLSETLCQTLKIFLHLGKKLAVKLYLSFPTSLGEFSQHHLAAWTSLESSFGTVGLSYQTVAMASAEQQKPSMLERASAF